MKSKRYFNYINIAIFLLPIGFLTSYAYLKHSPVRGKMKERFFEKVLIDDFGPNNTHYKLVSGWSFITDQVMGGASTGKMEFGQNDKRYCLHMAGNVSLQNNGGFIQARAELRRNTQNFGGRGFTGIYLIFKGNSQPYAVHIRTRDTRLPWQYYQSRFDTDQSWQKIKIPFTNFRPINLKQPLNVKSLKTVAISAIQKEYKADIFVDEIGFYEERNMYRKLTSEEERIILHKGTERAFSGKFYNHYEKGIYICKRCGKALFESSAKFKSGCGWPSFDDQIEGAVKWQPDADGVRTEIICGNCGGHLGHVFKGEGLTEKNIRHCVNSLSLDFVPAKEQETGRAIFASGCFWGTEYYFQRAGGVISTTVGYTGGKVDNPSYRQVCSDKTGHAEAVEVVYDPRETTYEALLKLFFETHDFTQLNRQGPDIGKQYRSAIFYLNEHQKDTAIKLVKNLEDKGYDVKSEITPAGTLWPGEEYHQDYYNKTGKIPYCHINKKLF